MTEAGALEATEADDPAAGEVLDGKYRLIRRLGRGGFGDVWRAEELLPDGTPFREVALKLLGAVTLDAHDWAEEAKLLASFRHPSLVTIYAAGILGGGVRFVAMELLEGQNLAEVLRERGPVPWRRVLKWAWSVASALDVIHARGVVHLDLKPANLFLSEGGALKVLDFGIARRAGAEARAVPIPNAMVGFDATVAVGPKRDHVTTMREGPHDRTALAATRRATRATDVSGRAVVGTPGFIAPEVLEAKEPTQAADAFALGVCVAQLATGRLPHDAPDEPTSWDDASAISTWLEALRDAAKRGAVRPLVPDLPKGAAKLVTHLLTVDPSERGAPAGHLAELVEDAMLRPYGVPEPPYPGLAALGAEAEGVIFGRDEDITRLGRELSFESCLVLQGSRGAGKTSLARAGLVPHLAHTEADGMDDWRLVEVAASDDPDAALSAALDALDIVLVEPHDVVEALAERAARTGIGVCLLIDALDRVASAPEEKRAKLEAIGALLATEVRRGVRLLATVDEERTELALTASLGRAVRAGIRFVGAPAAAAARDVAVGPARLAGAEVHDADVVVEAIESELKAGAGHPPIAALALAMWWATRERVGAPRPSLDPSSVSTTPTAPPARTSSPSSPLVEHQSSGRIVIRSGASRAPSPSGSEGRLASRSQSPSRRGPGSGGGPTWILSGARFREIGGVRGALARHADAVLASFDVSSRARAENILLRLTGTDGSSRAWPEPELLEACGAGSAEVVDALVAQQIVARRGGTVALAHQTLLSGWRRLSDLRLSRMADLALLERLRDAASAWELADRDKDLLLHGAPLEELRARTDLDRIGLGAREHAFAKESLRAARKRRLVRGAAIFALTGTLVAGLVGARALEVAKKAEENAKNAAVELEYVNELAAKSRRADDAYARVAFAAEAFSRGSPDAELPLDIAVATARAPRADVLTLEHAIKPEFFWDDRFLVAEGAGGDLVIADFHAPDSEIIEDVDIDADAERAAAQHIKRARVISLRPHKDALAEKIAFGFDTSFVTRSVAGEVKVHRLRESGTLSLVATAPMRCAGPIHVARDAPVVVCSTQGGLARWDLRKPHGQNLERSKFHGTVEDDSPDGERIAAKLSHTIMIWRTGLPGEVSEHQHDHEAPYAISFARFSPDGRSLAVVSNAVEVLDVTADDRVLFASAPLGIEPASGRWDAGGVDVGVCTASGHRRWVYLRRGGRAEDDPKPQGDPCRAPRRGNEPEAFSRDETPKELRDSPPEHLGAGGFRLPNQRILTRDLVVLDPPNDAARRLLSFRAHDEIGQEEEVELGHAPVAIEREGSAIAAQVGDEIRVYGIADEARYFARRGTLLRRCSDGRLLALHAEEVAARVFDVWTGRTEGYLSREPGFVVGADGPCSAVYTQRLSGELVAHTLHSGERATPRVIARPDGYAFTSRPARAGHGLGPGLWLALSSGAVAHVEDATFAVRVVGRTAPRPTAIADGPAPGEVSVLSAGGVSVLDGEGHERPVLESFGDAWQDLSPSADGASMLLASPSGVGVLDALRHEVTGFAPLARSGRFSTWDDDGSVLVWSEAADAPVEGLVIPRNRTLARTAAALLSNLEVQGGRLLARR